MVDEVLFEGFADKHGGSKALGTRGRLRREYTGLGGRTKHGSDSGARVAELRPAWPGQDPRDVVQADVRMCGQPETVICEWDTGGREMGTSGWEVTPVAEISGRHGQGESSTWPMIQIAVGASPRSCFSPDSLKHSAKTERA